MTRNKEDQRKMILKSKEIDLKLINHEEDLIEKNHKINKLL